MFFAVHPADMDKLIEGLNQKITLGTVVHGPGHLRFFGLNIHKYYYYYTSIDENYNMQALEHAPIQRTRRQQIDSELNEIGRSCTASLNRSLG